MMNSNEQSIFCVCIEVVRYYSFYNFFFPIIIVLSFRASGGGDPVQAAMPLFLSLSLSHSRFFSLSLPFLSRTLVRSLFIFFQYFHNRLICFAIIFFSLHHLSLQKNYSPHLFPPPFSFNNCPLSIALPILHYHTPSPFFPILQCALLPYQQTEKR